MGESLNRQILMKVGRKKGGDLILEHGPGDDGVSVVGASTDLNRDVIQEHQDGSLLSSFANSVFDASASDITGVSPDKQNGTLWVCDSVLAKVYNISTTGTLISSFLTSIFDVSATSPSEITSDPNGSLWLCDAASDKVYNISKTGSLISSFATSVFDASATSPTGITIDSNSKLWIVDSTTDKAYNIERDGTLISTIDLAAISITVPTGITYQADTNRLWICDNSTNKVVNLTTAGVIQSSFDTPFFDPAATFPLSLGLASDNTLWLSDRGTNLIYHLENNGEPDDKVVFIDSTNGDDGTGDGTQLNPYATILKGESDIDGATKIADEWVDGTDADVIEILEPIQASRGTDPFMKNTTADFTWTTRTGIVTIRGMNTLAFGDDTFVMGAGRGIIQTSLDGINWTQRTGAVGFGIEDIHDIAFNSVEGVFLAVGTNGKAQSSSDKGVTWTDVNSSFAATNINVALARGSGFVIAGDAGKLAIADDLNFFFFLKTTGTGVDLFALADKGQTIITGGASAVIRISFDKGDNWSGESSAAGFGVNDINDMTFAEGLYVAVGNTGKIQTRPESVATWTERTGATVLDQESLVFGNEIFMAVGSDKSQTSPDGITWTLRDDTISMLTFHNVGFGKNLFITSGAAGAIESSHIGLALLNKTLGFQISQPTELIGLELIKNCTISSPIIDLFSNSIFENDKISNSVVTAIIETVVCQIAQTDFSDASITLTSDSLITIEKSRIQADKDSLVINSNMIIIKNSLIIANDLNENALIMNGTAISQDDIAIEQNTIIRNIDFNNTGGNNFSKWQDNIFEGSLLPESLITLDSGNIRGSVNQFVFASSRVASLDPLFADLIDFKLQREIDGFGFDSSLVQASVFNQNSASLQRDLGAWNFNDSALVFVFQRSHSFPKPKNKGGIKFVDSNVANLNIGLSGAPDSFIDPKRATEKVILTFESIEKKHFDVLKFLESQKDMIVELALFPQNVSQFPTSVTVNGVHSIDDAVLKVTTTGSIKGGDRITVNNKEFFVIYPIPLTGVTNSVVLAEVLTFALSGGETVTVKQPIEFSEFHYIVPQNRTTTLSTVFDDTRREGIVIELIRQANG